MSSDEIYLAPHLPLEPAQFERVERDLREILKLAKGSPGIGLIAQAGYLLMLSDFIRKGRETSGIPATAGPESHMAFIESFRAQMREGTERPWERLMTTAAAQRRAPAIRRGTLACAASLHYLAREEEVRARRNFHASVVYLWSSFGVGDLKLPGAEKITHDKKTRRFRELMHAPELQPFLQGWAERYFQRGVLRQFEDVRFSQDMVLLWFGLLPVYCAQRFPAEAGPSIRTKEPERLSEEELAAAAEIVEREFGPESPFSMRIEDHPQLKGVLESFFRRPLFAFAMVNA